MANILTRALESNLLFCSNFVTKIKNCVQFPLTYSVLSVSLRWSSAPATNFWRVPGLELIVFVLSRNDNHWKSGLDKTKKLEQLQRQIGNNSPLQLKCSTLDRRIGESVAQKSLKYSAKTRSYNIIFNFSGVVMKNKKISQARTLKLVI